MSGNDTGGVEEEFLAESQEIVETLARELLSLETGVKGGHVDPESLNEIFRGVHTLKGIAGMFGYQQLGALAHVLEDLLDDLRLGRVDVTPPVMDVLFEGVESFQRLLAGFKTHSGDVVDLAAFALRLDEVTSKKKDERETLEGYEIDPSVLSVLTEYEEHRLRTNVADGIGLFWLRLRFDLSSIDSGLADLKTRLKSIAEIITYLPSMDAVPGDAIELDVLVASRSTIEKLAIALAVDTTALREVARRQEPQTSAHTRAVPGLPALEPALVAERVRDDDDLRALEPSLRSVSDTVRVDIRKLDHLMNVVGELAIVRGAVARLTEIIRRKPELRSLATELHRVNRSFDRHLDDLQEGLLDVRMVPLGQVFDRLARVVRQVAREHEKDVRIVLSGAETEVDKLIVEELSDPLMHIIRNAVDHGIESPKARELAGKPSSGTLALNAYQKGNHVLIEVEDDGRGMDTDQLLAAAVRKKLVDVERKDLTRDDILNLIFVPGFSTREEISDTSGRGVGMDVVKTNILRLGGAVDVHSELGAGTKFTITLPITLAIISALVVAIRGRRFAIPLATVQEALLVDPKSIRTVEGREILTLRGRTLPLCRLDDLFGMQDGARARKQYVVVTELGAKRLGLVVDVLSGQQDIVVKALGKSLASVRGLAGATDLGDQRVTLVIDAPSLLEEVLVTEARSVLASGTR